MSTLILPNGVTIATKALARNIRFDATMLHCELQDERIVSVPLAWYPRLRNATVAQRNNWELIADGDGIHWPDIDEDLPVRAFVAGCEEDPGELDGDYMALEEQPEPNRAEPSRKILSYTQSGSAYANLVREPA